MRCYTRGDPDQIIVVYGSECLYPHHANLAETYQWVHNIQDQKEPKIESVASFSLDSVENKTVPFTNVAGGGTFSVDVVAGKPRSFRLGDYFPSLFYGSPVHTFGKKDWETIKSLCEPLDAEVFQQQDTIFRQNTNAMLKIIQPQVEGNWQLEHPEQPPGSDLLS